MSTTEQDLSSFTSFARKQIAAGQSNLTIDELFEQWRSENPPDELYAENVAAINASIQDYRRGDRGSLAGQHSAQLRREYGLGEK
jgi:hypothetical protein